MKSLNLPFLFSEINCEILSLLLHVPLFVALHFRDAIFSYGLITFVLNVIRWLTQTHNEGLLFLF